MLGAAPAINFVANRIQTKYIKKMTATVSDCAIISRASCGVGLINALGVEADANMRSVTKTTTNPKEIMLKIKRVREW